MSAWTPGPWRWINVGKGVALVGDHGIQPYVITGSNVRVRNAERDMMVDLNPDHPDARLISLAPEMAEMLEDLASPRRGQGCAYCGRIWGSDQHECKLTALLSRARGEE